MRFLSRFFRTPREHLAHGAELVAASFDVELPALQEEVAGREAERKFCTVDLIRDVLDATSPQDKIALRQGFARMMAFDSLIGANDRHAQNWGVVVNAVNKQVRPRFAPLFDSARGLFWNIPDTKLAIWDDEGSRPSRIRTYAQRSTPLIGIDGESNPNHFDVIDYMVNRYPSGAFAEPIRHVIRSFPVRDCRRIVHEAAGRYFSRRRLSYIVDLLSWRHAELSRICR